MNDQILQQAILRALSSHSGRARPISRRALTNRLAAYNTSERQIRQQIRLLRRAGHLIGSAPGPSGGYYLITSMDEYQEFMHCEYLAKIKDMSDTVHAMNHSARKQFNLEPTQPRLF